MNHQVTIECEAGRWHDSLLNREMAAIDAAEARAERYQQALEANVAMFRADPDDVLVDLIPGDTAFEEAMRLAIKRGYLARSLPADQMTAMESAIAASAAHLTGLEQALEEAA